MQCAVKNLYKVSVHYDNSFPCQQKSSLWMALRETGVERVLGSPPTSVFFPNALINYRLVFVFKAIFHDVIQGLRGGIVWLKVNSSSTHGRRWRKKTKNNKPENKAFPKSFVIEQLRLSCRSDRLSSFVRRSTPKRPPAMHSKGLLFVVFWPSQSVFSKSVFDRNGNYKCCSRILELDRPTLLFGKSF